MRVSCNGCRVLRKACNATNCVLRPCLRWIKHPDAQANATIFLAKFYGRNGLFNLITAGSHDLRPALFKSLLYEAAGRIVNPGFGVVGLQWSQKWEFVEAAVHAVLRGCPIFQLPPGYFAPYPMTALDNLDLRHVAKAFDGVNHQPPPHVVVVVDGGSNPNNHAHLHPHHAPIEVPVYRENIHPSHGHGNTNHPVEPVRGKAVGPYKGNRKGKALAAQSQNNTNEVNGKGKPPVKPDLSMDQSHGYYNNNNNNYYYKGPTEPMNQEINGSSTGNHNKGKAPIEWVYHEFIESSRSCKKRKAPGETTVEPFPIEPAHDPAAEPLYYEIIGPSNGEIQVARMQHEMVPMNEPAVGLGLGLGLGLELGLELGMCKILPGEPDEMDQKVVKESWLTALETNLALGIGSNLGEIPESGTELALGWGAQAVRRHLA